MQRCDVLVIGGGPGGSSCAWSLVRSGLDVLVLDAKTFPRDKICAGWVTPPVFEALDVDLDEFAENLVLQPITGFRTGLIGGESVETRYDRVVSYGIRRCEFDEYLLRRSGARLRLGERVKSLERTGDGWLVNGEIAAPMLVGAGGHFCPVARELGARDLGPARVVLAREAEFDVGEFPGFTTAVEPETPELEFCRDLGGYAWCFRKGNHLNVGLGRVGEQRLPEHLAEFERTLIDRGRVSGPLPVKYRGHAYQLYDRVEPVLVDDRVLLIGDSAGLAYPQSGEGIRPAVESGLIAANVIATAAGRYDAAALEPYRQRVLDRFGVPRGTPWVARLPSSWLRFAAGRLLRSRRFARNVVIDDWFLHANDPVLVP